MTQSMIDWDFALATAVRMTRSGPEVDGAEATDAVAELREGEGARRLPGAQGAAPAHETHRRVDRQQAAAGPSRP